MEHVKISLERFVNMQNGIDAHVQQLQKDMKKYEDAYNVLAETHKLTAKHLNNLVKVLYETSQVKVDFLPNGDVKLVTNYIR